MGFLHSLKRWYRFPNNTRSRILLWYFLLTAFTSVASILVTHHILYRQIYDLSREHVFRQAIDFQRIINKQRLKSDVVSHNQYTFDVFDKFLSQYEPVGIDDYAITLVEGQIYRHTELFPDELISQEADLIEYWGQLDKPKQGKVNTSIGELFFVAEPVVVEGQTQGVLVIVYCAANSYKLVNGAVLLIIPATLGVMGIAAAIAWGTTGRVLAPLRALTETAQSITETDMSQRITVKGKDEIAELTHTFNEMLDRLQLAFESQQEFLKDAGHELRTPITVIRGYLETLKYRPERQEQTIALAVDELDRMSRLVNDLLLLAKAERPDFLNLKPEELDWLTEELFLKVRSMADRNWNLESKGLTPIRVDRQRLTQAVLNLVQNSIRHTQKGDTITLGSSVQGGYASIWVSDTGEGIAPEDQKHIFERFARATTCENQGGNFGLGLSIVQAIVQAHQGWIQLQSEPGKGSLFTLVIPLDVISDDVFHEPDSNHRGQSPHHRLSGVWSPSQRLHDHRR